MEFDDFVLTAATDDLAAEPTAREHADAVEFRMDLAADPRPALADYEGDLPLIVTNRPDWEGGATADGDDRLDALATACEHPHVAAVDVELRSLVGESPGPAAGWVADHAREHGVTVIASVHDFETTPSEVDDLLSRAATVGDVGKLAVTAESRADTLALLSATHRATEAGHRVATMAMGDAGRHTRAVTPLYGSKIGYAPVDPADATAPGQYDLATLAELVETLR
ncbi:type I 3-dehydroquinate dehydratase [Salinirubrum litoreum]|uniref:3-dehydroquinate dehydratase n=1 Tax=Salinirubrum litoreum TaxID=1126234 RepID=A0ABD5RBU2_9EURY|nr:type I 3-dehydroquinate dehydratase [Salinirubrum litoreum]